LDADTGVSKKHDVSIFSVYDNECYIVLRNSVVDPESTDSVAKRNLNLRFVRK
jgi:hypothetical protein